MSGSMERQWPWPDFMSPVEVEAALGDATEVEWVADQIVARGDLAICAGAKGTGKTLLLEALAVHVAAGLPLAGVAVRQGPVLLLLEEDSLQESWDRLTALAAGLGPDLRELPVRLLAGAGVRLDTAEGQQWFAAQLAAHEPVLAVVDCFAAIHAGEENSTKDTNAVLTPLVTSGQRHGTAVVLIHHPTKTFEKSRASRLAAIRGNGTITQRAREVLWLGRNGDEWVLEQLAHNRRRGAPDGTTWRFRVEDPTGDVVRVLPPARGAEEPEARAEVNAVLVERATAYAIENPGHTTPEIAKALGKNKDAVAKALDQAQREGCLDRRPRKTKQTTRQEWMPSAAPEMADVDEPEKAGSSGGPSWW